MEAVSRETFLILPTGMMERNTMFQEGRRIDKMTGRSRREKKKGETARRRPPSRDYLNVVKLWDNYHLC